MCDTELSLTIPNIDTKVNIQGILARLSSYRDSELYAKIQIKLSKN